MKKKNHGALAGALFWSWAGEGRVASRLEADDENVHSGSTSRGIAGMAESKHAVNWRPGDSFTGDPPGELQGAFSVYDSDKTTLEVLSRYGLQF